MSYTIKKINILIMSVVFLLTAAITSHADTEITPEKEELQKLYIDFLSEEGYRPKTDADGDILFKSEGMTYFVSMINSNKNFLNIVLPNIWKIEGQEELEQVLNASDYSNRRSKAAKIYTMKDNVWVSIELFTTSPDDFKTLFDTAMGALKNGSNNFISKMREQQSTTD